MSAEPYAYPANVHLVWLDGADCDELQAIFATAEQAFSYIGRAKKGERDSLRYEPWAVRQP